VNLVCGGLAALTTARRTPSCPTTFLKNSDQQEGKENQI
jgi:hypothetical protein